jgi:hypothetical protein
MGFLFSLPIVLAIVIVLVVVSSLAGAARANSGRLSTQSFNATRFDRRRLKIEDDWRATG